MYSKFCVEPSKSKRNSSQIYYLCLRFADHTAMSQTQVGLERVNSFL